MSTNDVNASEQTQESAEAQAEPVSQPMQPFTVFDRDGRVVRKGHCPKNLVEMQAMEEGETVMEGDLEDMVTKEPEFFRHTVVRQYPSIGDQLDVIWKLLQARPELLTPEASDMIARIAEAKDAYPKTMTYIQDKDGSFVPYKEV